MGFSRNIVSQSGLKIIYFEFLTHVYVLYVICYLFIDFLLLFTLNKLLII